MARPQRYPGVVGLFLAAAVFAAGCESDPTPTKPTGDAPRLDEPGDPCLSPAARCEDDGSVFYCEDRVWTIGSCADICVSAGPGFVDGACVDEPSGVGPVSFCDCALADPDGCVPGHTFCVDETSLGECLDDQGVAEISCDEQCEAVGEVSQGCGQTLVTSSCLCTIEGTPCEAGSQPTCASPSSIAQCDDGLWSVVSCDEECGGAGECDPWGEAHACVCE